MIEFLGHVKINFLLFTHHSGVGKLALLSIDHISNIHGVFSLQKAIAFYPRYELGELHVAPFLQIVYFRVPGLRISRNVRNLGIEEPRVFLGSSKSRFTPRLGVRSEISLPGKCLEMLWPAARRVLVELAILYFAIIALGIFHVGWVFLYIEGEIDKEFVDTYSGFLRSWSFGSLFEG